MTRGDSVFVQNHRDWNYFAEFNTGCTVLDTTLRDLLAAEDAGGTFTGKPVSL